MTNQYDDIIDLPHPVSQRHARMTRQDRAAQFASFAALSGYGEAVAETARLTEAERILDESEIRILDARLRLLAASLAERPEVTVTYYEPDCRKDGGAYRTATGIAAAVDGGKQQLVLENGSIIPFSRLLSLDGEIFEEIRQTNHEYKIPPPISGCGQDN